MSWDNILKRFFASKKEVAEQEQENRFMPKEPLPTDQRFVFNFKKNGGKFIYCENKQEVSETFVHILKEIGAQPSIFSLNQALLMEFSGYLSFPVENSDKATVFLTDCENLVADNGSIFFTSEQIGQKKFTELPDILIVAATTSQLVNNLSEALRSINIKYKKEKPNNICDFRRFTEQTDDLSSAGSCVKETYLLLLENLDTP